MNPDAPYLKIAEHFDEGPLGAPKAGGAFSKAFIEYLKLLYKPGEAELVQHWRTWLGSMEAIPASLSAEATPTAAAPSSLDRIDICYKPKNSRL